MSVTTEQIRRRISQANKAKLPIERLYVSLNVWQVISRQVIKGHFSKVPVKILKTSPESKFWALVMS